MTTPPRHRKSDLLCALLAQQMSLITRDQLLEAANLWLEDPGRPMSALLQELGHLGPDDVSMLVEAVEMHKSPTGSGTAMERATTVDPDVREALLALRPPVDIRQWLVRLHDRRQTVPVPPPVPAVSRAARYDLGEEIARGGLGRVVEAHDRDLDRDVAVKLVLDDLAPEAAARFAREAKLTARLDHPSIVPIHDFGTLPGPDGRPRLFLCMKRIRGGDLGATLQGLARGNAELRKKWTRARMLGVFQDICLGMAYAHSKGVIHRDLKPSNVMIGDFGETLIVDWGLAKEMNAPPEEGKTRRLERPASGAKPQSARITLDGDVVGTPAYMPPEQAEGRVELIDERSDVFALGAILYAMLTLRPPWEGDTATEVLESVRTGRISAPSTRSSAPGAPSTVVTLRVPSVRGQTEPIPPELDAICMRALALRREDRFASALDLHHEIQLFLEGVKERERKVREATDRLEEGNRWRARREELGVAIPAQEREVERLDEAIESWRTAEEKKPIWEAEARLRELEDEKVDVEAKALAAFGHALVADPACKAASDGTCELLMQRYLEAEALRDRKGMLLARKTLAQHDRRWEFMARLDAPGKLFLKAHAYECGCLRPVTVPGWRVDFGEKGDQPWEDGGPAPERTLREKNRAVPWVRTQPPGASFGHDSGCTRRDMAGVPVFIAKYEERDKRLMPGPERLVGTTPIEGAPLPIGSYRCVLRPEGRPEIVVPVKIDRAGRWEQDVHLPAAADFPPGFRFVPGGPFTFGGEAAGGGIVETLTARDFFLAQFPVTCAEYLAFLRTLTRDEALARSPREGDKRFWIQDAAGIRLPNPGEDPRFAWEPSWPILGVSWLDALAYCAWISARDGRLYVLPHEEQFEKAIRGVDARVYAYGDEVESAYSHCNSSLKGKITPLPVGSFPADESPYGIRDLTGGVGTWCLNSAPMPYREWRAIRGGSWSNTGVGGRSGLRIGNVPARTSWALGFRLCVNPFRWPAP